MYEVHQTRDGITIYISQMDDEHLKNTINLKLRKIAALKGISVKVELNEFQKALYDLSEQEFSEKQANRLRKEVGGIYAYLAEAMLRGISYTEQLQKIFERTGAEGGGNMSLLNYIPQGGEES